MRPITYLASYPRSGNTFLRALLANYDSGLDRPLTVQEIALFGFGEKSEAFWSRCAGAPAETLTAQAVWQAREAYFDLTRRLPGQGAVMFKTHTLNGAAFDRPAFRFRPRDRIVYVVRHPLDVAVSGAHFYGVDVEAMAARMRQPGAANGAGPTFELTGSWLEHVTGWLNERRVPKLLVRYRDLRSDTDGQLRRILRFMGRKLREDRVQAAVTFSSFSRLQRSHRHGGFDQGPGRDPAAPFFRAGEADQWKTALPPAVASALVDEFGSLMDALKFERPTAADLGAEPVRAAGG